ncbi:MAG: phage tail protein, partial [Methanomicrobiales archaeon]|nr:phage tail protein [Methanomicrobiales archaeon]
TVTFTQEWGVASVPHVSSDEPSFAIWSTGASPDFPGATWVLAYYSYDSKPTMITTNLQVGDGHYSVAFIAKSGKDFYLLFGNGLYMGPDPLHLMKLNDGGGIEAQTRGLYDLYGGGNVYSLECSDNFLWALVRKGSTQAIVKIDRENLDILNTIPLTGVTNPRAISVQSDAEIYVVASSGVSTTFWRVADEQPPELFATSPGDTYGNGSSPCDLHVHNGLFVVDMYGDWGGFEPVINVFGDTPPTQDVPLWKIVRDVNIMAGLQSEVGSEPPTTGEIDVSDLQDWVHGYALTRSMTAREALLQLQQTYFFDARVTGGKLQYCKRGKAPVASITGADLAVRPALTDSIQDRLALTRTRESELPLRVHVVYNNWEANYQNGHEYAPRQITEAQAPMTVEIAVAINSIKARQVADALLAVAWMERDAFTLKTSRKWLPLDAADNVEVEVTER